MQRKKAAEAKSKAGARWSASNLPQWTLGRISLPKN
jgi:hypothetical protein